MIWKKSLTIRPKRDDCLIIIIIFFLSFSRPNINKYSIQSFCPDFGTSAFVIQAIILQSRVSCVYVFTVYLLSIYVLEFAVLAGFILYNRVHGRSIFMMYPCIKYAITRCYIAMMFKRNMLFDFALFLFILFCHLVIHSF